MMWNVFHVLLMFAAAFVATSADTRPMRIQGYTLMLVAVAFILPVAGGVPELVAMSLWLVAVLWGLVEIKRKHRTPSVQ